jgi:hypothetical protein
MAGLSMMARNTEDRIEDAFTERMAKMEGFLDAKWTKLEQHVYSLTSVVVSQKTVLIQKKKLMDQQHIMIQSQEEQLKELMGHQEVLQTTVQAVQDNVSCWRIEQQRAAVETTLEKNSSNGKGIIMEPLQQLLANQAEQMKVMIQQQQELTLAVQAVRAEVSEMRQKVPSEREQDLMKFTEPAEGAQKQDERSIPDENSKPIKKAESGSSLDSLLDSDTEELDKEVVKSAQEDPAPTILQEGFCKDCQKKIMDGHEEKKPDPEETLDLLQYSCQETEALSDSFHHIENIEVSLLVDGSSSGKLLEERDQLEEVDKGCHDGKSVASSLSHFGHFSQDTDISLDVSLQMIKELAFGVTMDQDPSMDRTDASEVLTIDNSLLVMDPKEGRAAVECDLLGLW